jgi:hypothetical protein
VFYKMLSVDVKDGVMRQGALLNLNILALMCEINLSSYCLAFGYATRLK